MEFDFLKILCNETIFYHNYYYEVFSVLKQYYLKNSYVKSRLRY